MSRKKKESAVKSKLESEIEDQIKYLNTVLNDVNKSMLIFSYLISIEDNTIDNDKLDPEITSILIKIEMTKRMLESISEDIKNKKSIEKYTNDSALLLPKDY